MKRNKIIALGLVSASLLGVFAVTISHEESNYVSAASKRMPRYNSNYWLAPHHIYTTKKVTASLIDGNFLNYLAGKHFVRKYKTIPKGTQLNVIRGGSDIAPWVIRNKSVPRIGKVILPNGATWVIRNHKTDWFKLGYPLASFKENTFNAHDGKISISEISAAPNNTITGKEEKTSEIMVTGRFTNKSNDLKSASDFVEDHLKFYAISNGQKSKIKPEPGVDETLANIEAVCNYVYPIRKGKNRIIEWDCVRKQVPDSIMIVAYDQGHKVGVKTIPVVMK